MMRSAEDSKEKRANAIRTVRRYLDRYRRGLVIGGICIVITDLLLVVNPWILKVAIDDLSLAVTRNRLFFYAGIFVLTTLVSGIFRFLMRRIMIGISRRIELDMRADFFAHLQSLSPEFYNRHRTGDLMALATNDLNAVRTLVGPGVMYTINTFVTAGFAISLMAVLSWQLTIAGLLPMAVMTVGVYHSVKVIHRLFERVQQRFASINSRAQENLSGIRVVKAYAREPNEIAEFEGLSQSYVDENMKLFRVQSFLQPLLTTVAGLGALFILAVGGKLVIDGAITLGTFVAFNGYLMMLVWPVIALGWVMNITERGLASMQRIDEITAERPQIAGGTIVTVPEKASIQFENVSFGYNGGGDDDAVLRDISLEIADGETVAIFGATGSGKSTLVALLLRLYDPSVGRILVGGQPLPAYSLEVLRGMIGLVPQDIFLFSDTIRANIGFGVTELEDPVLRTVSETASIHDEIMEFPQQFNSLIGERGINLSGGQKQRVAIARALARDPRILILDDALSSVDASTEERILNAMGEEMRHRTSIVISHRVSTARQADRVVVLDEGRIVESGTHDELVEHGGVYADMYHKQMIMTDLEGH